MKDSSGDIYLKNQWPGQKKRYRNIYRYVKYWHSIVCTHKEEDKNWSFV